MAHTLTFYYNLEHVSPLALVKEKERFLNHYPRILYILHLF